MLEDLKLHVLNIAKRAQNDGLCKHKSGNFSLRDQDSGLIVITPTGVDRDLLQARDMIVMNMRAEVVENPTGLKPTSEAMMHLRIYETRKDVVAIVHTHSMYATTFAVLNKPVPAIVYELFNLNCKNGYIPVAPYGRPGTKELAESIVEPLRESDVCLMKAHGCVAVDAKSIEEAYLKASYTEEIAELYYHTLVANGGKEPEILSSEELKKWAYPSAILFPDKEEKK